MRAWGWLCLAFGLWAQETPPSFALKGVLLEWDGSPATGELSVRAEDNHVYCFLFDHRTRFEREGRQVSVAQLKAGDALELVSDPADGPAVRYLRTVHAAPGRRPLALPSYRWYHGLSGMLGDELFPRGKLTFAGTVSRVNEHRLVLRTRPGAEKRILLREDTRYLADGTQVMWSSLKVNMRIFVRAGENLDGEVEAYQVVWGGILMPGGK